MVPGGAACRRLISNSRASERDGKVSAIGIMEIIKMKPLTRDFAQFLIIDDDPSIAGFLVTYLRQKGHSCEALTDGFQTANWLSQHDCEVAVVDLKMPKVDGISLITFIRESNPGLPIVVFTGRVMTKIKCMPLCGLEQMVT